MTPGKIDRGRQPNKEQESQWAGSQKRWSQSRPHDEANPKKGRTEGEGKSGKIQVGIDWTTMGIRKPVSKPDSRHPSFKPDVSGASGDQLPHMKSTVVKKIPETHFWIPGQDLRSGRETFPYLFQHTAR